MKRNCVRCGEPKGKGRHYVTVSVPDTTTKIEFPSCVECGNELRQEIMSVILKWRRMEK